MYNSKSSRCKQKMLASRRITLYNRQCWSLTAMKWKVADTPGRFAMAWCGKFPWRRSILEIGERRRENNGKRKNSYPFKAYDHRILDQSAEKIVETAKRSGATVSGPIPLPTEKLFTQFFVLFISTKILVSNSKCARTNV